MLSVIIFLVDIGSVFPPWLRLLCKTNTFESETGTFATRCDTVCYTGVGFLRSKGRRFTL